MKKAAIMGLLLLAIASAPSVARAHRHYESYGYYVNSQQVLTAACNLAREFGFWSPVCALRGLGNAYYHYHGYRNYHHGHRYHGYYNRYYRQSH